MEAALKGKWVKTGDELSSKTPKINKVYFKQ